MSSPIPLQVNNEDVVGIYDRMNRYVLEMMKCASSNVAQWLPADEERCASYTSAIREYIAWTVSQPQLDNPENHPEFFNVEVQVEKDQKHWLNGKDPIQVENDSMRTVLRILIGARDNLIKSASSKMSSGLIIFDEARFLKNIDKLDALMANYIKTSLPIDFLRIRFLALVRFRGAN
jgi:hypothetical protein